MRYAFDAFINRRPEMPWESHTERVKRELREELAKLLVKEPDELNDLVWALERLIDVHKDDLRDEINKTGMWDPDY